MSSAPVSATTSGNESWRAVVDALPDAALVLDHSGSVVHYNLPLSELFPRVRPGQPISHVTRSPELLAAVDKARASAARIVVELQDRVPVERRVSVIVTPLPLGRAGPGTPSLLLVFRDITVQEKLAQMRADFISYASHELRTPLASLRGFVETLQGPARDDPAARERFLSIMASQASRMTRLIDDLLSLSRIEMSVHLPPRGEVELNELTSFVVQSLEPLARTSGIALHTSRLPDPALVRGERDELVQVLQNLVHNAIKYGRPGGRVEIRLERKPRSDGRLPQVAISVVDDGPGIASEHLPRLTERFYRVDAGASREKGGTGLGLAIVKHIVQRHRGELKIASTAGIGSTFTVLLDELPDAAGYQGD